MSARTKQITVAGGNLYRIAADHLGDATAWTRIALANGMDDPFFTETKTLVIPAPDPALKTGGILVPR